VRSWRITLFAGVLVVALVGLANGHRGNGVFWGLLAVIALAGEFFTARKGVRGSMAFVFLFAIVLSLLLVAAGVGLIVAAVLAPSEDERNPYVGAAVLVAPLAAAACWATVAGYRRVRRLQAESVPRRSASEVYAELVEEAQAQQADMKQDPQRKRRQRRLQLFLGIVAVGWGLGRVVREMDENGNGAVIGWLTALSVLLMFGGLLAAGWTTVWVFKERSGKDG
jgi:hypothetical protein